MDIPKECIFKRGMIMREILFKAKRLDNGEWVEGFPFFYKAGQVGMAKCEFMTEIHPVEDNDWFDVTDLYCPKVDPNTLCQFTGLTDKNGKKIWENDIVDLSGQWWDACGPAGYSSPIVNVKWDEENCGFHPFANYDCDCGVYYESNECEVIGNIFDNQDLI